jgi:transcriptional regulator with XRE-family HTH domain
MHQDMTRIGRVLRSGREAKGMTQAVLSEKTHTALRTIIAIENDQRYPTYEVFYKIIHALDISADQIFWPENVTYTAEQEQIIREFLNCSEREQAVIMKTVRTLIRSLREENRP